MTKEMTSQEFTAMMQSPAVLYATACNERDVLKDCNATLRAERDALRAALEDCSMVAERLEAWAEAHHACAMRMPASEDCFAQQNLRDNYRAQANRIRAALARCKG